MFGNDRTRRSILYFLPTYRALTAPGDCTPTGTRRSGSAPGTPGGRGCSTDRYGGSTTTPARWNAPGLESLSTRITPPGPTATTTNATATGRAG